MASHDPYPDNPILVRVSRADRTESVHRGAWALCDTAGSVLDCGGDPSAPYYMRSATKALQALPLLETGAADHYGYDAKDLALALASHNAEECHTNIVERILARLDLGVDALHCGAQAPSDPERRRAMEQAGEKPTALFNNCSGKHAGFLALTRHLGGAPSEYLDPEAQPQQLVRVAMQEMTGLEKDQISLAIDGCSAPTFRFPLKNLAIAFARLANPEGLGEERRAACTRMLDAVAAHPNLIGGRHQRICSDLARITGGRLFPKIGAEAIYVIGVRGGGKALAIKMDDGRGRGLHALIMHLLQRFELLKPDEYEALQEWSPGPLRNWAGLEVGKIDVATV
jgi:L-asparaginase II